MGRKLSEIYPKIPTEIEGQNEFFDRISKTFYCTQFKNTDCLSFPVNELAAEIFTDVRNGPTLERLDIEDAGRISRDACVSPCSLVVAIIYVERLKDCNPEYLQKVAPSELFLVSLLVASKFLHDSGEEHDVYNPEWAKSGKLSVAKINNLEKEFLKAIKWSVFVDHKDFWKKLLILEKDLALREARKRGWFSYTELNTLLDSANLMSITQTVLGMSSLCIAMYVASIMTLLGSVSIATNIPKTIASLNQPILPADISNVCYQGFTEESAQIQEEIDLLLESDIEKTELCNQTNTQSNVLVCNCNNTEKDSGWNWLGKSITPWLRNLNHKFTCKKNWENNFIRNSGKNIKTNFSKLDPVFKFFKINKTKKKEIFIDPNEINYYKHDMKNYFGDIPKHLKSLKVM